MMIKGLYQLIILGLAFVLLLSCDAKKQRITQKANDQLLDKIDKYTNKIQTRCWDKIRKSAEQDVDSFLLSTAKQSKIKQIDKPMLNDRPDRPEVDFPDYIDPNE